MRKLEERGVKDVHWRKMITIAKIVVAIKMTTVPFREAAEISLSMCSFSEILSGTIGVSGGFGSMSSSGCGLLPSDESRFSVKRSTSTSAEVGWLLARNCC
jgi:hypothetical protein